MARKRYGEDDILRLIREVEVHCNSGMDVVSACRAAGVSDKTYYDLAHGSTWRNEPCSAERDEELGKDRRRKPKKVIADLELDELILKESLDYLKPKA